MKLTFVLSQILALVSGAAISKSDSSLRAGFRATAPPPSFCNPDPDILVWDGTDPEGATLPSVGTYHKRCGWLKTPLIHDASLRNAIKLAGATPIGAEEMSVALRVCAKTNCVAKKRAPIFTHCGGPGSQEDCLLMGHPVIPIFTDEERALVDNIAISQRGLASATAHAAPPVPWDGVEMYPATACPIDEPLKEVNAARRKAGLKPFNYTKLFHQFPGPTMMYSSELMEALFLASRLNSVICRSLPQYQLFTSSATGDMTSLDYVGTQDLANDLDVLRQGLGSEKLSLWGISYGTAVSAAYATVHPDNVERLVLDGNVADMVSLRIGTRLDAQAYESVWSGLATACDLSYFNALSKNGTLPDKTAYCAAAPLPTEKMAKATNYAKSLTKGRGVDAMNMKRAAGFATLARTAFENSGIMHGGVSDNGAVAMACVESLVQNANFNGDGCCMAGQTKGQKKGKGSRGADALIVAKGKGAAWSIEDPGPLEIHPVALVRAVDLAERFTAPAFIRFWKQLCNEFPIGCHRASNIISSSSAATLPRPMAPFGSSKVEPLIIGETNDPATSYANTQEMSRLFPNGAMITWQGYKHGLSYVSKKTLLDSSSDSAVFINTGWGAEACTNVFVDYLLNGANPEKGLTCPINGPAAGDISLGSAIKAVKDGFCLGGS